MKYIFPFLLMTTFSCFERRNLEESSSLDTTLVNKDEVELSSKTSRLINDTFDEVTTDADSVGVVRRAMEFLMWYKNNYDYLSPYKLVKLNKESSEWNYTIDMARLNEYKERMYQSHFFSRGFLERLNDSLEEKVKFYDKNTVTEVADGFDHDFIFHTQEMQFILDSLNKLHIISVENVNQDMSVIINSYQNIQIIFTLEDNNWKISEIR